MAYHIQKPSIINPDVVVYYAGDSKWTDDASQKLKFSTKKSATQLISNPDGKNGGWKNSTIVSE